MGLFNFLFGGNTSKSNSTSTTTPYGPTVQPINDYLGATKTLYGGGAPQISPLEQSGYDSVAKVAGTPSAAFTSAGNELNDTISGKYLTPDTNPYLKDIASRIGAQALQTTNSTFGGMGRSNSGLAGYSAGQAVGNSLTDLYGNEYNSERALQSQAAAEAPAYEQARYLAPQALISAGQNVSARPFDLNQQYGTTLANIAKLGGTTNTSGTSTSQGSANSNGLIGNAITSFTNKLFQ
jgi:hypothetical protein